MKPKQAGRLVYQRLPIGTDEAGKIGKKYF